MLELLKFLAQMIDLTHKILVQMFKLSGLNFSDKQMHFWIIGLIGITLFFLSDRLFKWAARLNISIISFIYTFTVLVVVVFGLEIQQRITHSGNMEFSDIVSGLWGFFVIFIIYLAIRASVFFIRRLYKKYYVKNMP